MCSSTVPDGVAERHAVLGLRLGLRDGPQLVAEIDVLPAHRRHMRAAAADDVAGAYAGQNQEFERAGGDTVLLPQIVHEGRHFAVVERWMVLVGGELGLGGEQMLQVVLHRAGLSP
jgi:hypothetical protein